MLQLIRKWYCSNNNFPPRHIKNLVSSNLKYYFIYFNNSLYNTLYNNKLYNFIFFITSFKYYFFIFLILFYYQSHLFLSLSSLLFLCVFLFFQTKTTKTHPHHNRHRQPPPPSETHCHQPPPPTTSTQIKTQSQTQNPQNQPKPPDQLRPKQNQKLSAAIQARSKTGPNLNRNPPSTTTTIHRWKGKRTHISPMITITTSWGKKKKKPTKPITTTKGEARGVEGGQFPPPPRPHPNSHPLNIYLPIFSLCMLLFALSLYSATLQVILCYGAVTFGSICNVLFLADDYQEAYYIPLQISFLVIIALTWNFILKIFQTRLM